MKFKLNALEKKWILYDVGNSAFTLLVSTIMPIYFNYLAGNAGVSDVDYLAYWGYAVSVSTVIVAILGPVLGTFSDFPGWKRKIFLTVMLVGALGCVFLGFTSSWLWFLLVFVIAKSAYSLSLVIYDSMLTDITDKDRMDEVSSMAMPGAISEAAFLLSSVCSLYCFTIRSESPWNWPWEGHFSSPPSGGWEWLFL